MTEFNAKANKTLHNVDSQSTRLSTWGMGGLIGALWLEIFLRRGWKLSRLDTDSTIWLLHDSTTSFKTVQLSIITVHSYSRSPAITCFTATWLQIKWHLSSLSFSWWCKWIQTETEQSELSIPGEPEAGKHKRALKSMTCSRPYSAARSRGVSCWLFLIVGSVSSCSSTETTSVCPYWAAQWRAVSFWWFCEKKKKKWLQDEVGGRWTADTPGVRWTDRGGET